MKNLCWAVPLSTSGHARLRHNDVIKFSPGNFVIYKNSKNISQLYRIWRWRHRSWPEVEKWTAQHKFPTDYDAKRIRAISLTSFQEKIQNCPPLKKISTWGLYPYWNREIFTFSKGLHFDHQIGRISLTSYELLLFSFWNLCRLMNLLFFG